MSLNHIKSYNRLPYIYISDLGGRFLIDTGASQSLINPEILKNKKVNCKIKNETHFIKTAHATSKHKKVAYVTLPKNIFKKDITHKFLIFNFDSDFEGLLGLDLLGPLNCKIDMKNKILHTENASIPIRDDIKSFSKLEPRCEQVVNFLCKQEEGDYFLERKITKNGLIFPAALVTVKNGNLLTTVVNESENEVLLKRNNNCNLHLHKLNPKKKNGNYVHQINTMEIDEELDEIRKQNLNNLRTSHMNDEEKRQITKLCYNYRDIFHCEEIPLTFTHEIKHQLRLTDDKPIYVRNYRQAPKQKLEIKKQINKLLEQNIIQESNSPWSCPVHIVPKKLDASGEQKYRLVIDYRKLNDKTVEDKYPLPNIDDILDKLGRAHYFTTLDLASGYHQVEMHPQDIEKTAFTTDRGHYEFLRMPFGLKNAPSTFQRLMDSVLRGVDNVLTYLDDIIIYSTSLQEHIEKCTEVFNRFRVHNLKIQPNKSEFLKKQVEFLGHTLTDKGLKPNENKISAVKQYPLPKTQKEIKSFLGLVGYYRKFIQDFAKLTKPLTKCLKKGNKNKVEITEEYIQAFEKCKQVLINAPILQYPDFDKPFILTTDASDVAIGAVLSQGKLGTDKPVAYASRTLSDTEQRYSTIEKELLGIVWAIKYFRPYLYGKRFTIFTDHRPLTWLMSLKDPNSKLTRWRLRLAEYDFDVQYKKGKINTNADALSRIQVLHHNTTPTVDQPQETSQNDQDFSNIDIRTLLGMPTTPEIVTQSSQNESVDEILENTDPIIDSIDKMPEIDDAIDRQLKQFHIRKSPGDTYRIDDRSKGKTVIKDVWIPINNTENEIINFLKEHTIPDRIFHCYFHHEDFFPLFCKLFKTIFSNRGPKLVRCKSRVTLIENIPEQLEIIRKYHEGKTIHRGIQETYKHIHRSYHWPNMLPSIQKFINKCDSCLKSKYERNPLKLPLALTDTPIKPMEHMFMDLYSSGGTTFLTLIDNFTKYAQAIPLTASTSIHIAEALLGVFSTIGIPKKLTTDSDSKFDNEVITEVCAMHNIHIHFTTPYNPNSNSPIERLHSTLAELIRIQRITDKDEPCNLMKYAIIAYNNTIHSATGFTPFELLYGHTDSRNPLELHCPKEFYQEYVLKHKQIMENVQKLINQKLTTEKQQVIQRANQNTETATFKVGDKVYKQVAKTARNNKLETKYIGPYTIVRLHPEQTAEIVGKHVNAKTIRVHFRLLRRPENVPGTSSPASRDSSSQQAQQ